MVFPFCFGYGIKGYFGGFGFGLKTLFASFARKTGSLVVDADGVSLVFLGVGECVGVVDGGEGVYSFVEWVFLNVAKVGYEVHGWKGLVKIF